MDETKQQIIYENNIYILRYMGGDVNSNGIVIKDGKDMPFPTTGYHANGFLLYDDDWNWLMPVLNIILNLEIVQENIKLYYQIIDGIPDIKKTYEKIVEFIKENK